MQNLKSEIKTLLIVVTVSVIITAAGIWFLRAMQSAPTTQAMCEWRPSGESYGPCQQILGVYFNGESCAPINGCNSGNDVIPFSYGDLEKCQSFCKATVE